MRVQEYDDPSVSYILIEIEYFVKRKIAFLSECRKISDFLKNYNENY